MKKSMGSQMFVPGQLLLGFKKTVTPARAQSIIEELGAEVVGIYSPPSLYLIALPDNLDVETGSKLFGEMEEIEFAEPNHIYRPED